MGPEGLCCWWSLRTGHQWRFHHGLICCLLIAESVERESRHCWVSSPLCCINLFCNVLQGCAYQKGICAMCGKQILDVAGYKQSTA